MSPGIGFGEYGDGGLGLFSQGQGIFDDRRHVAAFIALVLPTTLALAAAVVRSGAGARRRSYNFV